MAVCSNCHQQIPEISAGKFCPFCGASLASEPAPVLSPVSTPSEPAAPVPEPIPFSPPEPTLGAIPWEQRQQLGFLTAFSQTWSESVFRPTAFFRRAPKTGNLGAALLYGMLIAMTGTMLSLFWTYWFWDASPEVEKFQEWLGEGFNRDTLRLVALLAPVGTIIWIFLAAFIYHVCLMITGSSKNGFEATLRGFCYSYGPHLFSMIPQCGAVIAMVWQLVLMVIAWRELHESRTGRVVVAVILPLLLCCGFVTAGLVSVAGLISRLN